MGNSGQNFLDLLFGGVNKGVERFGQQKREGVDLALTIQQMLQRQKQGEQTQSNVDRNFNADEAYRAATLAQRHGEATAKRMEGAGERFDQGMAQKLALHQQEVKQQKLADFAKRYPQFAPAIELMGMGAPAGLVSGAGPDASDSGVDIGAAFQKRMNFLLSQIPKTREVPLSEGSSIMLTEPVPLEERMAIARKIAMGEHTKTLFGRDPLKGASSSHGAVVSGAPSSLEDEIAKLEAELGL